MNDAQFFSIEHLTSPKSTIQLNEKTQRQLDKKLAKEDFRMRDAIEITRTYSQRKDRPCSTHYILVEYRNRTDLDWTNYHTARYGAPLHIPLLTKRARLMRIEHNYNDIEKEFTYDPTICFQLSYDWDIVWGEEK